MPQVKCSVSNCHYWEQNNHCGADAIMIDIDNHAEKKLDVEFALEGFRTEHQDKASRSANTCCHTFKPRKQA
jgi:hypothetical protein